MLKKVIFPFILFIFILLIGELFSHATLWILEHQKSVHSPFSIPFKPTPEFIEKTKQVINDGMEGQYELYKRFDPELGWTLNPNKIYGEVDGIVIGSTNNIGTRNTKNYTKEIPKNKIRISSFGDSFTHGSSIPNHATWQEYLEGIDSKLEVLNYGVPGYGTDQSYLRYLQDGVPYSPNIVIIGYMSENLARNVNIFRPFYERGSQTHLIKPRFVLDGEDIKLIPNPIKNLSEMDKLLNKNFLKSIAPYDHWSGIKSKIEWWQKLGIFQIIQLCLNQFNRHLSSDDFFTNHKLMESFLNKTTHHYVYKVDSEAYQVTLKILEKFYSDIENSGSKPVVLLYPDRFDLDAEVNKGEIRRYMPLAQDLRERNMRVIDAMDILKPLVQKHGLQKITQSHYKPLGNAGVAHLVYQYLIKFNLI